MKILLSVVALITILTEVVGCGSVIPGKSVDPVKFVGPNKKDAYSMHCSGFGRTIEQCYQKAIEVCPNGYNIIDNTSGTAAVMNQGGTMIAGVKRDMAIECK
jgi:hypothetical protein